MFSHLQRQGAWTMHARGVMPTVSSPNWASMIMGAGPEQHGVTSNEWQPHQFEFPAVFSSGGGRFPTVFGILREQQPKAHIAVFHDWDGFGRLVEPGVANTMEDLKGSGETLRRAMQYWNKNRPHLMFIHLDDVDHAGHEKGHGTPEYYEAVRQAGELLAELGEAIKDSAAYLIVTADHGGKGKKHGGNTLEELEIPWMITGPKVRRGHQIQSSVNTFDTAATVAWLFQLRVPQAWIGRPVLEAFVSP